MPGDGQHLLEWQKKKAAQMIAAGIPPKVIAEDFETSVSTISRIKREKRHLIEAESARFLESLPSAVDTQKDLIQSYPNIDSIEDPKRFEASVKASENLLKAVGLLASNATSIAIQNIYNDNRTQVLSPGVASLLERFNHHATADSTPDPEIEIVAESVIDE